MSSDIKRIYELGPFRLDTANRLLMRGGAVVPLKQKAVELLLILLEHRGEVLEKDVLMQRLWPDTFVEEANLTQTIYLLRKALEPDDCIETIPRRGYRFVGDVSEWTESDAEVIIAESTRSTIVVEEREVSRLKPILIAAVVVVIAVVAVLFVRGRFAHPQVRSIAVLPFRTLGSNSDAYLGLGMADALITKLSASGNLVVRPTNAVAGYANTNRDSIDVGHELRVDSVIDGSIQREKERLRISVRLVRTSDGRSLWAERFDEPLSDVFALQDSISARVTDALQIRLSEGEQTQLAKHTTTNTTAYQAYLKGRFFWNKRTGEGLHKSIEYFQQAIDADPRYALAYSGLADAYVQLPGYSAMSSMEIYPRAKAAAETALRLDPSLAEAHNSLASVLSYFEWNWSAAEQEFRRAIALNPNCAAAHHRLGVQLAAQKRVAEARAELEHARELDPLSLIINALVAFTSFAGRDYDRAIAELHATLEMDRNFPPAHQFLAHAYQEKGMVREAFAEYLEWRRLEGDPADVLAQYRRAYERSGLNGFLRQRLDLLLAVPAQSGIEPMEIAALYAQLGEKDEALLWIEKAVEQHEGETIWLKALPDYDNVRADPRFADFLRRVNLAS